MPLFRKQSAAGLPSLAPHDSKARLLSGRDSQGFMAKPCTPYLITRKGYATSVRQQSCQRLCNAQRPRVKFVGTVYDQELLKYIRENAFAYFHGHEVGGTNPSLLEALESTKLNLLLDVGFNREVGEDGALYWKKDQLAHVIDQAEQMDAQAIEDLNQKSSQRIAEAFTWEKIVTDYEKVFKG